MIGKLLYIFISLSFRSAYGPDLPFDYEGKFGFDTEKAHVSISQERERGDVYLGVDCKYSLERRVMWIGETGYYFDWEAEWYLKEATGINTQTLRLTAPLRDYNANIGIALNSNQWQNTKLLLSVLYSADALSCAYETNFKDRHIQTIKLSKQFEVSENDNYTTFLEPLLLYKSVDDVIFWQCKLSVGVKIKP